MIGQYNTFIYIIFDRSTRTQRRRLYLTRAVNGRQYRLRIDVDVAKEINGNNELELRIQSQKRQMEKTKKVMCVDCDVCM